MLPAVAVLTSLWTSPIAVPLERSMLAETPRLACVGFWTEARFAGLAYNHIVHLANGCDVTASCTVRTNVNPEPQTVTVPPGAWMEVVTFIGSPASAFTADVQCVR